MSDSNLFDELNRLAIGFQENFLSGFIHKLVNRMESKMTDTFRKEYNPLSDKQKKALDLIKDKASELHDVIVKCDCLNPDIRQAEYALMNLEQCVMWAVKSIT